MRSLEPDAAPLPREVLTTSKTVLRQLIDDDEFGATLDGLPVLSALRARSLLCVPLRDHDDVVYGALTLIRCSNRSSFRLADQGLLEEIGEHIGMALAKA